MENRFDARVPELVGAGLVAGDEADNVELVIPAAFRHVRLARLTVSGIGSHLGADVDKIEELRLLVDEACALLLECAVPRDRDEDRLHVAFRASATTVTFTVERPSATLADRPSPVTVAVLDAISQHWSLRGTTVVVVAALDTRAGDERGAVPAARARIDEQGLRGG